MIPFEELLFEVSLFIGLVIFAIVYGVYLGIYYLSTLSLLTNSNMTRSQRIFYMTYGSVLFLLNIPTFVSQAHLGQMMWITDRDSLNGSFDVMIYYSMQSGTNAFIMSGDEAQNIIVFLADTLLIYRCYRVFGSRWYIVLLPALCAIGNLIMSTLNVPIAYGAMQVNSGVGVGLGTSAIMLTMATNILTTGMICFKILSMLHSVRGSLESSMKRTYMGIINILIESAAPSAILGMIIVVFNFLPPPIGPSIYAVWASSFTLFPQLIIFRISQGTAWTKTTSQELTQATEPVMFTSSLGEHTNNSIVESASLADYHDGQPQV